MKKRIKTNLCIIFLLIICIISLFKVYTKYNTKKQIQKVNSITYNPDKISSIEYLRNRYNNEDIIGILKIASIHTVLVQGNDNNYYLNHLVSKEENKTGSIFVDYRQKIDSAKQLNVYGHSSDYYDLPFNTLLNYEDINFYKENKYAEIMTEKGTYKYEISGVKITSNEEHLKFDYTTTEEYQEHINILHADNLYETDVKVDKNDKILIIQTCTINDKRGNLLIIILRKVEE